MAPSRGQALRCAGGVGEGRPFLRVAVLTPPGLGGVGRPAREDGVERRAEQQDEAAEVEPGQQEDDGPENAVALADAGDGDVVAKEEPRTVQPPAASTVPGKHLTDGDVLVGEEVEQRQEDDGEADRRDDRAEEAAHLPVAEGDHRPDDPRNAEAETDRQQRDDGVREGVDQTLLARDVVDVGEGLVEAPENLDGPRQHAHAQYGRGWSARSLP